MQGSEFDSQQQHHHQQITADSSDLFVCYGLDKCSTKGCMLKVWSPGYTIGRCYELSKQGSSGHWGCAVEGDCGILFSSNPFFLSFLPGDVNSLFPRMLPL
jgi:hypothetical protein